MALKTTLEDAKDRLDALLTYANGVTGVSDTSIGDAIETLADLYTSTLAWVDDYLERKPMNEYVNETLTTIGITNANDVFGSCQIKKVYLPNVTSCPSSYTFHGRNVSTIEELYCPKLTGSGYGFAENNPNLRIIDFGKAFGMSKNRSCPSLETIIIRNTSKATISSSNFTGCTNFLPDGTGGKVYVPQSLLSAYQSDTSWQTYAKVTFYQIEGSIYELDE